MLLNPETELVSDVQERRNTHLFDAEEWEGCSFAGISFQLRHIIIVIATCTLALARSSP